jgi:predicted Co/Zn/Cd cation transporter (cation efflux family)
MLESDLMLSIPQALKQTLFCALVFAAIGSLVGLALGCFAPVYDQTVFALREEFDPGPMTVGASVGGCRDSWWE